MRFFFFVLATLTFFSTKGFAQSVAKIRMSSGESVTVSAQNYSGDLERGVSELSGNVRILYKDQVLKADKVTLFQKDEVIDAYGHVLLTSPQTFVAADHAVINYATNTGWFENGYLRSGQVTFEGKMIRKTGPEAYSADRAYYTACTTCPTAWTFSGSHIDAELGGYTYIKNSVLEVGGLPILWLPYLIVPLKSERQSGLLSPSLGVSADSAVFELPFFWAISRSQDATFTLKNYSKRGPKALVNHRYVLSPTSMGELNTAYIDDLNPQSRDVRASRWFMAYQHSFDLPNGIQQKTKINLVSDLRYPREFSDEIAGLGDTALENRVSLTKNTERMHNSLDMSYYINQLKRNPTADNRDAVHRFPEIKSSLTNRRLFDSNWFFNLNTNYVNFAREDYSYDDVENTTGGTFPSKIINPNRSGVAVSTGANQPDLGVFSREKDIVRAGQRFDINPEISRPFQIGDRIDVLPSASLRAQQYSFNLTLPPNQTFDTQPSRQYVRTKVSMKTRFNRVFGHGNSEEKPRLLKHEIEPELIVAQVPWLAQTDSPFWGRTSSIPVFLDQQPISDADFLNTSTSGSGRGIQFDTNDWVTSRDYVRFSINNKFIRKEWSADEPSYRQVASLKFSQGYDINEGRRGENEVRFPWSDFSTLLDVRLDHIDANALFRYFPHHKRMNSSSRVRFKDLSSNFFELSYAQSYLITQNISDSDQKPSEALGLGAGLESKYVGFVGGLAYEPDNFQTLSFNLRSWNAVLKVRPPGNCIGISATINYNIGDPSPSYSFKFDYNFGGGV